MRRILQRAIESREHTPRTVLAITGISRVRLTQIIQGLAEPSGEERVLLTALLGDVVGLFDDSPQSLCDLFPELEGGLS